MAAIRARQDLAAAAPAATTADDASAWARLARREALRGEAPHR
jgi:hypothetical protein